MKLSVIIVNYNVKHFIEQCLHSVNKALTGIDAEIFVVDNNSVDGSCAMMKEKFPQVKLIENKKNVGFSTANNQAIRESAGEYVLLLNPDTVVQEDTFSKCIAFMDAHPDAGGMGVKMIDGKGNFLPESKRALPTPAVSFYKIFGLSRLFPKSKTFGRYHLGFLNKDKNHEIEILSGAYMLLRKETLNKSGLLDETFFMYGEDIDLSYRILKAGYKNYYFAETTIIHYKGESTKKGSLNYVKVFYEAMIIFAEKHFSKKNFRLFAFLIRLAIYLRAALAIFKRFIKAVYNPLLDGLLIFSGYLFLKPLSESFKFSDGGHYPGFYMYAIVPAYTIIWLVSLVFSGTYDKPLKINNILKGIGIGSVVILAIYGLLPLEYRFSRFLIILGALWSIIILCIYRYFLHILNVKPFRIGGFQKKRIIIVGDNDEALRVKQLLLQTQINPDIVGYVSDDISNSADYLGNISQIEDIATIYKAEELIFCAKNIAAQEIINHMLNLSRFEVEYKIAPPESLSIIGSNSINTAGDLYLININSIGKPNNKRSKRLFDIISSFVVLIIFPAIFIFLKNRRLAFVNIFKIFLGNKTWVGYYNQSGKSLNELPKLKSSVLSPVDGLANKNIPEELKLKLNFLYAKDYKFTNDFNILLKSLLYIGR